jgi:hypothetical protein
VEGAKRGFARGRVWPRRLLDARRYPLSRYRRGGASSETRFTKRTAALGSIDLRTTEAFHRCAQTVCYFFSALERSPLQARRRLWCRHCPSAHAAVAPGSPRVHRARWARKPKENTAWVRVPCPRRRTAPRPSRHPPFPRNRRRRRRLSGDDAPTTRATTSEQPERRVRYKTRPRSFPRRRVSASIARASRRLSLSPSTRARHHERATAPLATPTLTTAALSFVPNPQTSSTTWRRSRATARARRSSSCN